MSASVNFHLTRNVGSLCVFCKYFLLVSLWYTDLTNFNAALDWQLDLRISVLNLLVLPKGSLLTAFCLSHFSNSKSLNAMSDVLSFLFDLSSFIVLSTKIYYCNALNLHCFYCFTGVR